jgi:S1-C subfamily serine protease
MERVVRSEVSQSGAKFLSIFFILLTSRYVLGQRLPDTIDKLRPAIIQIKQECTFGNAVMSSSGTGFLVNRDGFALTAAHVVDCPANAVIQGSNSPQPLTAQRSLVGIPVVHVTTDQTHTRRNFTYVQAEIIESDHIHDVALLKISRNPFKNIIDSGYTLNGKKLALERLGIAMLGARKPREGEAIAISGYPVLRDSNQPVFDTNAGIVASIHSSRDRDLPTYFNSATDQLQARVTFDLYEADMRVNPGNSGGPVYNSLTGEVIGVCSAFRPTSVKEQDPTNDQWKDSSLGYNSGLAIVIPIAYGTILMSQHAVNAPQQRKKILVHAQGKP